MQKLSIYSALALTAGLSTFACVEETPGPTPQEARSRSKASISNILDVLEQNSTYVQNIELSESLGLAFDSSSATFLFDHDDESVGDTAERAFKKGWKERAQGWTDVPALKRLAARYEQKHRSANDPKAQRRLASRQSDDWATAKADIIEFLETQVFTEENLESVSGDTSIFLLDGTALCTYEESDWDCLEDEDDCARGEVVDEECEQIINDIQVRVAATSVGDDGLDIGLRIGAAQHEPWQLQLRADGAATQLRLAPLRDALGVIMDVSGEEITLPEVMQGELETRFEALSNQSMRWTNSVLEPVHIEMTGDSGIWTLDLEATSPTSSVLVDGDRDLMEVSINMGELDFSMPWSDYVFEATGVESTSPGIFYAHLDGVSGTASMQGSATSFEVQQLGLGDETSYLARDTAMLATLDINPANGRQFAVQVSESPDTGSAIIRFSPGLNASVALQMGSVATELELDPTYLDETFTLDVSGSAPGIHPYTSNVDVMAYLEVVDGTVSLQSSSGDNVTIAAGQCIVDGEGVPHEVVNAIAAASCG